VNTTPTSPTPGRRAHPTDDWPLLARLPDVGGKLPADTYNLKPLSPTATTAYRFDAPKIEGSPRSIPGVSSEYEEPIALTERLSDGHSTRLPQPHLLQRTWRVDRASPASRNSSAVLPSSNPFSIPSTSLHDAIAPLVRFVMLVVLFTAAGTTILLAGKTDRPKSQPMPPAAAAAPALLQPTTIIEPTRPAVEQPIAATTATGPSADASQHKGDRLTDSLPAFPDVLAPPPGASMESDESGSEQVRSDPGAAPPTPAASAPDFLSWPLTGSGRALPQVQTSEPPTALAHFPGHILESPPRQASNDDESSVH
jgi:hypothetical protein